ncbi:n-acetylglutamate synthase [Pedobacter sp. 22226]|uniref:n-acetylglutamate synthase n=1 Tax=Pedobacter sp. 22226 TaxID=3453894 RepID=UPI003F84C7BF
MINYNNKHFRPVSNTENGETSAETIFKYQQTGNILTSAYAGGRIIYGHLIGLGDENGQIEMRYHQVNDKGKLMTGICNLRPEQLAMVKSDFIKHGNGLREINRNDNRLLKK